MEPPSIPLGVNLAGYLGATAGIGAAARQVVQALRAADVAVAELPLVSAIAGDEPRPPGEAVHPATIVCANPDGMQGARDQIGSDVLEAGPVIGLWWWEVPGLPQRAHRAFDLVDEVWVGSRHVADLLAAVSPVPVVRVPLPVPEPEVTRFDRDAVVPAGTFAFGFAYDYASVAERKNPLGLIDAFRRAHPAGDEAVALVLKTMGGEEHPAEHSRVVAAAAGDPRVRVLDARLPAGEKNALIAALDCYVSLHRAEGFGLTIAEAMLLGTPVIATDAGGSRDFVTTFNALLADHRPVLVGAGHDPYPADAEWADPDPDHAAALMRRVRAEPDAARGRAERAAADVRAAHAPAVAGAAMAARLARVLHAPERRAGVTEPLDLDGVRDRIARGPQAVPGTDGARAAVRGAALRAMAPATVHQRLVDEELLGVLRTLDERVRALAAGQQVLAAEIRDRQQSG